MTNIIFNHGVVAFRPDLNHDCNAIATNTIALANRSHPEWEICCSREDQFIGYMGFICTGIATALYEKDCCSYIDENGKRVAEYEEYRCDEKGWYNSIHQTEAFVKNVNVHEFWVRHEFYNEYLHAYQELSAECGLPHRTIKEAEGGREHARRFNRRMQAMYEFTGDAEFDKRFNAQMLTAYHGMFDKLFLMGVPIIVITPIENMEADPDSPNVRGKCVPYHFRHRVNPYDMQFIAEETHEWVDVDELVANDYRYFLH